MSLQKKIVKIVLECNLVTRMDEVCKMVAKHLLRIHPDKLLNVFTGKDHLPTRPNHKAEAVQTGEKVEGVKLVVVVFLFRLRWHRWPYLHLWVWCIRQISYRTVSDTSGVVLFDLSGPVNPLLDANSRRKIYLDLV